MRSRLSAVVGVLTIVVTGVVLLGTLLWMAWLWWRTPGIVRAAEAGIAAPFDPTELRAGWISDLLAIEDPAFFSHHGIDLWTPGGGWTTISQGLAKDLYFEEFRPGPMAKLEQSLAALVLDARVSKDRQLRLFLGRVYMGEAPGGPVHGFSSAAQTWLGKDILELDRSEFLSLVAMVIGPNEYGVATRPQRNAERRGRIERLLAGACRPTGWGDVTYEACAR
ncbi:MAG TPA: transglycosylase domain-containing protein [Gemmatimonadota bacterium]|nr:transglycosylase domain-containing protein [Gemmatimonadota bacterium]